MIMNLKYAERTPMLKNAIHCLLFLVLISGCATTQEEAEYLRADRIDGSERCLDGVEGGHEI